MRQILRQGRAQIGIEKTAAADNPAQRGQGGVASARSSSLSCAGVA